MALVQERGDKMGEHCTHCAELGEHYRVTNTDLRTELGMVEAERENAVEAWRRLDEQLDGLRTERDFARSEERRAEADLARAYRLLRRWMDDVPDEFDEGDLDLDTRRALPDAGDKPEPQE